MKASNEITVIAYSHRIRLESLTYKRCLLSPIKNWFIVYFSPYRNKLPMTDKYGSYYKQFKEGMEVKNAWFLNTMQLYNYYVSSELLKICNIQ